MRITGCVLSFFVALSAGNGSTSDSISSVKRDNALRGIEACRRSNEVSSRACRHQNADIAALKQIYERGDKSVLPTLFQFTSPSMYSFYQDALVADSEGFLGALSKLPENDQKSVIDALTGGVYDLQKTRFDTLNSALSSIPSSSPIYELAHECAVTLVTKHADLFLEYFPPQTFSGTAGQFKHHTVSRALSVLGEGPLLPLASATETVYRLTVISAWGPLRLVKLTLLSDGRGEIVAKSQGQDKETAISQPLVIASKDQIDVFQRMFKQLDFPAMPTEENTRGFDGADWIFESVQEGKYHVVDRWCPGKTSFGDVGRALFAFAGQRLGDC